MKVVLAPNAFKGSASAGEVAKAMARGVLRARPDCEIVAVPIADGGDGLHDVAMSVLGGREVAVRVAGPDGRPVDAGFVVDDARGLAVIEMARASGLALLRGRQLDPTRTSTVGTGELMRAALDSGGRHLVVGIGGSATNDGGVGMATALGWRFLDVAGDLISPVGGELARIATIDGSARDERLRDARIDVVCDVDNPLCGDRGASMVYGPQKGATPAQVAALDRGLAHLADVVAESTGTDSRDVAGAGAAGGLGFGLRVFVGGVLRRGTDVIFEWLRLDEQMAGADLVLTGEGCVDAQTLMGKGPAAVALRAKAMGIPCIALAGSVGDGAEALRSCGIEEVVCITPDGHPLERAMSDVAANLEAAAARVTRSFVSRG